MKRLFCLSLMAIFILSITGLPVYAKKAGTIKDNLFTDANHGFSFEIPGGWSAKVSKKGKMPLRAVVLQKSYPVPRALQGFEDYAATPTITVMVDTTSLKPSDFIAYLRDSKSKSKQKKYMLGKLKIISRLHDVMNKKKLTFAKAKAYMEVYKQVYELEVAVGGSDRAEVINDYYSGAIFCTVRDGKAYIFHFICEREFYAPNEQIFMGMINSIKFE